MSLQTKIKLTLAQKQKLLTIKKTNTSSLLRDRTQAVLIRNEDFTLKQTAKALQRSETFVKEAIKLYQSGTLEQTGFTSNNHKLSEQQRKAIITTIQKKTPDDIGYQGQFWTMKIVKLWIKKKYKVAFQDEKSYRNLFKAAGFSFHKPQTVDFRQDPKKTKQFKGALKKSSTTTRLRFSW